MRSLPLIVIAIVAGIAGSPGTPWAEIRGGIVVEQAWARASILKSRPGVAYLMIRNEGSATDRLVAVTSPLAGAVAIHASEISGGTMRMHAMEHLEIPPGRQVTLKPGGMHLMLMGLREPLREGDRLPIVLEFEHAGRLEVSAQVLSPAAKGPESE